MKVETIKIKADNELGYIIINKDDFDPKVHEEFSATPKRKRRKKDGV